MSTWCDYELVAMWDSSCPVVLYLWYNYTFCKSVVRSVVIIVISEVWIGFSFKILSNSECFGYRYVSIFMIIMCRWNVTFNKCEDC